MMGGESVCRSLQKELPPLIKITIRGCALMDRQMELAEASHLYIPFIVHTGGGIFRVI